MRVVFQTLYRQHDHELGRAASPRFINWTPNGDGLTFWQGERGENGLWLFQLN
jgi:hypothetical protein